MNISLHCVTSGASIAIEQAQRARQASKPSSLSSADEDWSSRFWQEALAPALIAIVKITLVHQLFCDGHRTGQTFEQRVDCDNCLLVLAWSRHGATADGLT